MLYCLFVLLNDQTCNTMMTLLCMLKSVGSFPFFVLWLKQCVYLLVVSFFSAISLHHFFVLLNDQMYNTM